MKMLFFLIGVLVSIDVCAGGGGTVGNGGDPHVIEYLKISEEICKWALQSGASSFPKIRSCQRTVSSFRASLHFSKKAKIEFVMIPLEDINGVAKVAIFHLKTGSVKVNRPSWQSLPRKDKYVVAAIELAGLTGVNNRYDFGALVDSQFTQVFAPIKFPELRCSFGTHEGPRKNTKIQFFKTDIDEFNKALKEISGDPNASCGICQAEKGIVISQINKPAEYQVKVDREYLIDRPYRLQVSLLNAKGQLENQSSVDAYAEFVTLEYFPQSLEFQCERVN